MQVMYGGFGTKVVAGSVGAGTTDTTVLRAFKIKYAAIPATGISIAIAAAIKIRLQSMFTPYEPQPININEPKPFPEIPPYAPTESWEFVTAPLSTYAPTPGCPVAMPDCET